MQPRNIEVFDGLRITTDHFDHLQGSIHSALEDFRGILGLARVHRGFGVTAVDEHSIQVDPGLAFDSQRRRIVNDEPVKLEVPAAVATASQFVCVSYDQGADGEVEGHMTRIWDAARVDIRAAPPSITDDAIVIAELQPPAEGAAGFTIRMGAPAVEAQANEETPTTEPPTEPPPAEPKAPVPFDSIRAGVFLTADAPIDRMVHQRMASAIRDGVTSGKPVAFTERLASQEVLAGVVISAISIDSSARLATVSPPPAEGEPPPTDWWWAESAGHGQAYVGVDGAFTQFGAGTSTAWSSGNTYSCAAFVSDAVLTLRRRAPKASDAPPRDAWLAGLALTLRCVPRNRDGFAIDAMLEWSGQGTEPIAAWLEAWPGSLQWMSEGGWSAIGISVLPTPAPTPAPVPTPASEPAPTPTPTAGG